jgi:predicted nucleic acid-binding protein
MCKDMVIPAAVAKEINEGPSDDPAKIWLNGQGKKWIKETGPIDPLVATWDLGAGESQVISWAYRNIGYEVILDDRAARKCALSLKILVRGTIGIILLAHKEKRLANAKSLLEQLVEIGFRIDPEILEAALRLIKSD